MDLNPSALLPSACRPHIPYTERSEQLKMYGDAEVTESTTIFSVGAPATIDGSAFDGGVDTS